MTSELRKKINDMVEEYIECDSPMHRISTTQEDLADTLVDINTSLEGINKSLKRLADAHVPSEVVQGQELN